MIHIKQPTTYLQQLELLREKHIIISDENVALTFLNQVSYYRLSGYFLPFQTKEYNANITPMEFQKLLSIYEFDQQMRTLITNIIDTIEVYLRAQLSYFHVHKYGPEGYILSTNYNCKHNHDSFLVHINKCIQENQRSPSIRHHIAKYNRHFPLWVIIEYFSIGMVSYFYSDLPNADKSYLANQLYNTNYQTLESWLRCLTDLRNRCAHYSRLYYWTFTALPKMPKHEVYVPTRRLFAQLYMLHLMYPDHNRWNDIVQHSLFPLMETYKSYISTIHLDFPDNWLSMLLYQ